MRGGREGGEAADDGGLAVDVGKAGGLSDEQAERLRELLEQKKDK